MNRDRLQKESANLKKKSDSKGELSRRFEAAHESGAPLEAAFWLEELAELYIREKERIRGAHLLNAAISLIETFAPKQVDRLLMRLASLEVHFIGHRAQKSASHSYSEYRQRLDTVRRRAKSSLSQGRSATAVGREIFQAYSSLLSSLIQDCLDALGTRPTGFAVLALGSLARKEVSPFSDVEFAFLIEEENQKSMEYYSRLERLLEFKIINMGETRFDLIRPRRVEKRLIGPKSVVSSGFSLDSGGLSPRGIVGLWQLIGTPERLAQFQDPNWVRKNDSAIILVNAMSAGRWLMGSRELAKEYQKQISEILDSSSSSSSNSSSVGSRVRQRRAIELIRGHVAEFQPRLDLSKIEGRDARAFNIKRELYRPLHSIIDGLALYHGLNCASTRDHIDALVEKSVLTQLAGEEFKTALALVRRLRMEVQLFYGTEEENLYFARGSDDQSAQGLFCASAIHQEQITWLYQLLIPLYQTANRFLSGNQDAFYKQSVFRDSSIGQFDDRLIEKHRFSSAMQSALQCVALAPNDPKLRDTLRRIQEEVGAPMKALTSAKEVLQLVKRRDGNRLTLDQIAAMNSVSNALFKMGRLNEALSFCNKALDRAVHLHTDSCNSEVATVLMNLGVLEDSMGRPKKAVEALRSSLLMFQHIYGTRSCEAARCQINLGVSLYSCDLYSEAKELLSESVLRLRTSTGNDDQQIAAGLSGLGLVALEQGLYFEAADRFKESISILTSIYKGVPNIFLIDTRANYAQALVFAGKIAEGIREYKQCLPIYSDAYKDAPQPAVARLFHNLGEAYAAMSQYKESIQYYKKSLDLKGKINNTNGELWFADTRSSLAAAYANLGDFKRAQALFQQVIDSRRKEGGGTGAIAKDLHGLANCFSFLGQYQDAIANYREALKLKRAIFGDHPHTARTLEGLAGALMEVGKFHEAILLLEEALKMRRATYRKRPHQEIASALSNLGELYRRQGRFREASNLLEEAVKMCRQLHGKSPRRESANSLGNLGLLYLSQNRTKEAVERIGEALAMKQEIYKGSTHPEVAHLHYNLGMIFFSIESKKEALLHLESADKIYRNLRSDIYKSERIEILRLLVALHKESLNVDKYLNCMIEFCGLSYGEKTMSKLLAGYSRK